MSPVPPGRLADELVLTQNDVGDVLAQAPGGETTSTAWPLPLVGPAQLTLQLGSAAPGAIPAPVFYCAKSGDAARKQPSASEVVLMIRDVRINVLRIC